MHRPVSFPGLAGFLLGGLGRLFGGHLMAPDALYQPRASRPMRIARGARKPGMRYPNGSRRAGNRYTRLDMHGQQQRSHDPSWQAMNPHIRAHLYGDQ